MDALVSASALLPGWARMGAGLALIPLAFGVGWAMTGLATRVALPTARRWEDAPWTARAQAIWPARLLAALCPLLAGGVLGVAVGRLVGPGTVIPAAGLGLLCGLAAYTGGAWVAARLNRQILAERRGVWAHIQGELGGWLMLAPTWIALAAMLALVRAEWSLQSVFGCAIGVVGVGVGSIWSGVPLARVLGLLHPPRARLRAAVDRAARSTGVAPRALYEVDLPAANAAALTIPAWLFFTRRCVEGLDDDELEAIACHELGHVSEPRWIQVARVAGSMAFLPFGFLFVAIHWLGPLLGFFAIYAAVLFIAWPLARVRRRMEERADAVAHDHEADPGVYARALERLYEINLLPAVMYGKRAVHPHLYDRLVAAGVEPTYPRPKPPSSLRLVLGLTTAVVVTLLTVPLMLYPRPLLVAFVPDVEQRVALGTLLGGAGPYDWKELSSTLQVDGRNGAALAALDASLALEPGYYDDLARRASLLALLGRCEQARVELERATAWAHAEGWEDATDLDCMVTASGLLRACATQGSAAVLHLP